MTDSLVSGSPKWFSFQSAIRTEVAMGVHRLLSTVPTRGVVLKETKLSVIRYRH